VSRTIYCTTCGTGYAVLKEGTAGGEITYFDCCAGRTSPRQTTDATILQFPAASERLGGTPAQACDVTRRGDSSCREVPGSMIGESGRPVPSDELLPNPIAIEPVEGSTPQHSRD
jgi:hypothetical protein